MVHGRSSQVISSEGGGKPVAVGEGSADVRYYPWETAYRLMESCPTVAMTTNRRWYAPLEFVYVYIYMYCTHEIFFPCPHVCCRIRHKFSLLG